MSGAAQLEQSQDIPSNGGILNSQNSSYHAYDNFQPAGEGDVLGFKTLSLQGGTGSDESESLFQNSALFGHAKDEEENNGQSHLQDGQDPSEGAANQDVSTLSLRALVSSKEAGVIIGKAGKNVAELRDATGVKAGVSKVVPGVHDRILTVAGSLEGVSKAFSLIAQSLLENPITSSPPNTPVTRTSPNNVTCIRLLISHNLMGTIIGAKGVTIKQIQDASGARMVASKEMLPQSTERVVEIQGTVEAIRIAIFEISKCLIEDKDRGAGTVLYNPAIRLPTAPAGFVTDRRSSYTRTGNGSVDFSAIGGFPSPIGAPRRESASTFIVPPPGTVTRTQEISIPSDMVGCIIGKGGSKIAEIRRRSGSYITIAKTPHDESGERMFTITGTPESTEMALFLLYGELEGEKERRLREAQFKGEDE